MNGHEFLRLASRLAAMQSADEATLRTAVSRAYYGVFHLAKSYLADLGIGVAGHAQPHQFLSVAGNQDAMRAAICLAEIQSARIIADYRLERPEPRSIDYVREAIEMAFDCAASIERCRDGKVREQIRASIEAHLERRNRPS
jgi:hypothetical protein